MQSPETVVVNPDPADWTPQILDGQVNAILQMGTKVVVGGTFTQVRRAGFLRVFTRNYLFAFDMETGVDRSQLRAPCWMPTVEELAPGPDGTSVFVGGDFGTVNGQNYKKLVRLNLADGSIVTSFKANANRLVQDVVCATGGSTSPGSSTRSRASLVPAWPGSNPTTGAVDPNFDLPFTNPLRGTMGVPEIDVSPDGSKLMALGSFSRSPGQPRVQIAQLDLTTTPPRSRRGRRACTPCTRPTARRPGARARSRRICATSTSHRTAPTSSSVTTGAFRANRLCDSVSRFELTATGPNQAPTWTDWTGGDTTWSVSVSGTAVYVGGHMRWVNNPYRGDIAGPGAGRRAKGSPRCPR